jgi:hypothetical protein
LEKKNRSGIMIITKSNSFLKTPNIPIFHYSLFGGLE